MSFKDRSILVTGGSRGIGRAVALALGARGATVAVHYARREEAGAAVVEAIANRGGRAFAVNVRAPLLVVQAALPLPRPGTRVVTVSAAITRWANSDLLIQSAAKAALQNLSRNLAAALGPRGVGVVDVAPGATRTGLAVGLFREAGS